MALDDDIADLVSVGRNLTETVEKKSKDIDDSLQAALDKLANGEVSSFKIGGLSFNIDQLVGSSSEPYLHLKTNIPQDEPNMIALNFSGFRYGIGVIDTDVSFYTFQDTEYAPKGILHSWNVLHKGAHLDTASAPTVDVTYYFSDDRYLVLVIGKLNQYSQISVGSYEPAVLRHNVEFPLILKSAVADKQM